MTSCSKRVKNLWILEGKSDDPQLMSFSVMLPTSGPDVRVSVIASGSNGSNMVGVAWLPSANNTRKFFNFVEDFPVDDSFGFLIDAQAPLQSQPPTKLRRAKEKIQRDVRSYQKHEGDKFKSGGDTQAGLVSDTPTNN